MQTAIKATQLSKSYGRLLAVDHISLSVKYGTVYGRSERTEQEKVSSWNVS